VRWRGGDARSDNIAARRAITGETDQCTRIGGE